VHGIVLIASITNCLFEWTHEFTPLNLELVRRDSRSDEREREERWGKKYKGFGRDGEIWETIGDFSTFLEKRYRLSKELASEYISFAFVSSHKVECKKKGVQVCPARTCLFSPTSLGCLFAALFCISCLSISNAGLGHH
jgi:hypothetical protein